MDESVPAAHDHKIVRPHVSRLFSRIPPGPIADHSICCLESASPTQARLQSHHLSVLSFPPPACLLVSTAPAHLPTLSSFLISPSVPEWNFDILPAWFAYVPMKMDYTDIPSVLAFFRGSPPPSTHSSQTHAHAASFNRDEVARRIGANGACWVQRTWRKEDLTAYVWRLYLEWARIERGGEGDYEE